MDAFFHVAHRTTEPDPTRELPPTRGLPPTRDVRTPFEYRAGLATGELIAELLRLLGIERGAERLVCRYLADLADRIQRRRGLALTSRADELRAARGCFGLGPREARERVRIGRALRQLPEIERALVDGELSYSRVREITRVATAGTELEWLELARQLDMRSLERRVARTMTGAEDAPAPEAAGARARRVTFELSEEAWSLLERALEAARAGRASCSDGEALEVVARVALSAQGTLTGQNEAADASGSSPTTLGPPGAAGATKAVRPWSWDDLPWGATQSGSSRERSHPRAAEHDDRSRHDDDDRSRQDHATPSRRSAASCSRTDDEMPWGATGWPRGVATPGLPQTRTCGFPASGSSHHGFAKFR